MARVSHVEQHDIVAAVRRHGGNDAIAQIAVRIDEGHASAGGNIAADQPVQQRGFSYAGLAFDEQVPAPVVGQQSANLAAIAKLGLAEDRQVGVVLRRRQVDRRLRLPALNDGHRRRTHVGRGRMPKGCEFLGGREQEICRTPRLCRASMNATKVKNGLSGIELPESGSNLAEPAASVFCVFPRYLDLN